MSRGAYDPGDTRTQDMVLEDLFPDTDQLGNPWPEHEATWEPITRLHRFPVVFGVTAAGTSASADTGPGVMGAQATVEPGRLASSSMPSAGRPGSTPTTSDVHG